MPKPVTSSQRPAPTFARVIPSAPSALVVPAKKVPATKQVKPLPSRPGNTPAPLPKEFMDLLTRMETARAKKNDWDSAFKKLEAEVKDQFAELNRTSATVAITAKDSENHDRAVELHFEAITDGTINVESLDKAKLKKLVTPDIYDKCTVIQKGLVRDHAGEIVLQKITTLTPQKVMGTVVSIESKKVKAAKAAKKPKGAR